MYKFQKQHHQTIVTTRNLIISLFISRHAPSNDDSTGGGYQLAITITKYAPLRPSSPIKPTKYIHINEQQSPPTPRYNLAKLKTLLIFQKAKMRG